MINQANDLILPEDLHLQLLAVLESAPDDQSSLLQELCSRNPEWEKSLRLHIERASAAHIDFPLLDGQHVPPPPRIHNYDLGERIGQGGMGVVYEAVGRNPTRTVAIKLLRLQLDDPESRQRFRIETETLAAMQHDSIARIYEVNTTQQGQPYFVMEYVHGEPITSHCDRHALSIPARLQLFLRLCQAVQHAHFRSVVHRDLKPGNILVKEEDGRPVPKVLDFGLAKVIAGDQHFLGVHTADHRILGTVEYMAPEQAAQSSDVDARADVYSLGVILYELLSGELPLSGLRELPWPVVCEHKATEQPTPPSRRWRNGNSESHQEAVYRNSTTQHLARMLRGDLDAITLTALQPTRNKRYSSAQALADDIAKHLNNETVAARPLTLWLGASKLIRRNRRKFGWAAIAAIPVAIALIVTLAVQVRWAQTQLDSITRYRLVLANLTQWGSNNEAALNRTQSAANVIAAYLEATGELAGETQVVAAAKRRMPDCLQVISAGERKWRALLVEVESALGNHLVGSIACHASLDSLRGNIENAATTLGESSLTAREVMRIYTSVSSGFKEASKSLRRSREATAEQFESFIVRVQNGEAPRVVERSTP